MDTDLTIKPAENLPEGYIWVMYSDGSGRLQDETGVRLFSYDKAPYANVGWIEYQEYEYGKGMGWSVFQDSFSEFMTYAEECVLKKISKSTESKENDDFEEER